MRIASSIAGLVLLAASLSSLAAPPPGSFNEQLASNSRRFAKSTVPYRSAFIAEWKSAPQAKVAPVEAVRYTVVPDLVYAQGVTGPLQADAYIPNGPGLHPGLLFIHGGGWVNGNRNQMLRLIKALADAGYAAFTIEYDVKPVHFPSAYDESLAALRYFREHAAQFHLDSSRIGVVGSSAGGELAALVALRPAGGKSVQAAVILNGVLDLTGLGDESVMVTNYLGGPCTTLASACKAASPQLVVHPGAPPFYVGHGTADATVPYAQAEAFVAALQADHVPVETFVAEGGPHTFWAKDDFYAQNLAKIQAFLDHTLRNK